MRIRCVDCSAVADLSDKLQNADLRGVTATGAGAKNTGIAAALAEFGGASVILGSVFSENFLDKRVIDVYRTSN